MRKMNPNVSTSSFEYLGSFAGAILLSFGLGVMFFNYFQSYAVYIAVLGLIIHSFAMYKMYK